MKIDGRMKPVVKPAEGGRTRLPAARGALVCLAVLCASCHLVVGLERQRVPERDAGGDPDGMDEVFDEETVCSTNDECDDGHGCTEDTCNLSTFRCEHSLMAADVACRPSAGMCDAPEACDGRSVDCPADAFMPATEVCRAAVTVCDEDETCTGDSAHCPDDAFKAEGEGCDDGNPCTHSDACDGGGSCVGINALFDVRQIAAGDNHACVVLATGEARCWGENARGQLGDGTTFSSPVPRPVSGLPADEPVLDIACGGTHTCAVLESGGDVYCWGYNAYGQLGNGTTLDASAPNAVSYPHSPMGGDEVSGGLNHTCAAMRPDGLHCWGDNREGQCGNGDRTPPGDILEEPTAVVFLPALPSAIDCGGIHSCAVFPGGELICWGRNSAGQLGFDTWPDSTSSTPFPVTSLGEAAVALSLGFLHTCAVVESGGVKCWGDNAMGQLGGGTTGGTSLAPVDVTGLPPAEAAVELCSGNLHTCAVLEGGGVWCWGDNREGQLGDGTTESLSSAVEVAGLSSAARDVACGSGFSCALLQAGTLQCWGGGWDGQLGSGSLESSPVPVDVVCEAP
jgi:alpha-tubulin suppressor-like RCC1 family protein